MPGITELGSQNRKIKISLCYIARPCLKIKKSHLERATNLVAEKSGYWFYANLVSRGL